jgi:hypothetical protein
VVVRHVRELEAADRVADREDALVGGAQARVYPDAFVGVLDAGALEAEPVDVDPPACRDEHTRARHLDLAAVDLRRDRDAVFPARRPHHLGALAQHDPLVEEARPHDRDRIGVVLRKNAPVLQDGDRRAEPAIGLGQLDADGPAA